MFRFFLRTILSPPQSNSIARRGAHRLLVGELVEVRLFTLQQPLHHRVHDAWRVDVHVATAGNRLAFDGGRTLNKCELRRFTSGKIGNQVNGFRNGRRRRANYRTVLWFCRMQRAPLPEFCRRLGAKWGIVTLTAGLLHCGGRSGLDGGALAGVGGSATAANTATAGASAVGGSAGMGANAGTGCTGNLEVIERDTGLCVAKMATISGTGSFASYLIDVTEVTQGQYADWLRTSPALPAISDANCGYVTSYAVQGTGGVYAGPDAEHHPVVYVDWCDAYAYCAGIGKRLCGAIGGGATGYDSYRDAAQSQWHRACSSGGAYVYPYGNTYQPTACASYDYWNGSALQTVAVGSLPDCVTTATGFAGVYDLSGNVWEWEDSCADQGPYANCRVRGGAFYTSGAEYLACGYDNFNNRISVGSNFGFRCCSQ